MPRHFIFLAALFFFAPVLMSSRADAQVVPDPRSGKTYIVRDASGKIIERLAPAGSKFDLIDPIIQKRIGWVDRLGPRLMFYNMLGQVIGTAKFELLPPGTSLEAIAVVRDPLGHMIGLLSHY